MFIKDNMYKLAFFVLLLSSLSAVAQRVSAPAQSAPGEDLVEIIKSDELEIINENGVDSRRVINGIFKHKGAFLHSNLAIQNINTLSLIHI